MSCFQIPGYTLLNENRTFSTGGGVALYVRSGYTTFLHIFNKVSNTHAPLKKAKIKHVKHTNPGLLLVQKKSMKVGDKLYKKWLITRNYVFLEK